MAKKILFRSSMGNCEAVCFKDEEWEELVVKFYVSGKEKKAASYHTDDPGDAVLTANLELERMTGGK